MFSTNPQYWMKIALEQAVLAGSKGEVPVGAVLVKNGSLIAATHNMKESLNDPTGHAEILAIKAATNLLGNWRLVDCELYVTLEPCIMCTGAIQQSRIKKVYIGIMDPRSGACGSLYEIHKDIRHNHRFEVEVGLLADECREVLRNFFRAKRLTKKSSTL